MPSQTVLMVLTPVLVPESVKLSPDAAPSFNLGTFRVTLSMDVRAVSYTHLDVYKRQGLQLRLAKPLQIPMELYFEELKRITALQYLQKPMTVLYNQPSIYILL